MGILLDIFSGIDLVVQGLVKLYILVPIAIAIGVARILWHEYRSRHEHESNHQREQASGSKIAELSQLELEKAREIGKLYAELSSVQNVVARISKYREKRRADGLQESEKETLFGAKWNVELHRIERQISELSQNETSKADKQNNWTSEMLGHEDRMADHLDELLKKTRKVNKP